jgi:uncharacterized protein (DUF169 family)
MESRIAQKLNLKYQPVAVCWTDDKPAGARGFKEGKWACVMWLAAAAAKGETACFDKKTYGCWGGGVGLGFGNEYLKFPGGIDCFYSFLSNGNAQWQKGRDMAEKLSSVVGKDFLEEFLHGEGYMQSPELVKQFVDSMPITEIPNQYVVFKPLKDLEADSAAPQVMVFFVDPDQLSALVVLANYGRPGNENVIAPFAAGCQQIGIFPYREAQAEHQRAVIGLTDISARKNTKNLFDRNILSFAIPWRMFLEMESQVEDSFLTKKTWAALRNSAQ